MTRDATTRTQTMRYAFGLVCIAAIASFVLVECGDTTVDGTEPGWGGEGGNAPEMVRLFMRICEFEPPLIVPAITYVPAPLKGVEVCEYGTDNCAKSDLMGFVELDFPRDHQEIAITANKEGYAPRVFGNVTDEQFPDAGSERGERFQLCMFTHDEMATVAERLGTTYPWEGGIVGLVRLPSSTVGVRFVPVGPTVDEVGDSFYFDSQSLRYSRELGSTTFFIGLWGFPLGEGGFIEVTAGARQFELTGNAGDCPHESWAWPGDGPNRIRVPVIDGYITYGSMRCDSP